MLPQLTALAVENGAGNAMPSFTTVTLSQRAPPFGFVIDVSQRVQGLSIRPNSAMGWASRVGRSPTWSVRMMPAAGTRPSFKAPASAG
jgi:hypothetical protein